MAAARRNRGLPLTIVLLCALGERHAGYFRGGRGPSAFRAQRRPYGAATTERIVCLRNRRKNSQNPRPAGPSPGFLVGASKLADDVLDDPDDQDDDASGVSASRVKLPGVWSNRSLAARRRWADPVYRENLLEKRRARRAARPEEPPRRLAIGPLDSVVFSPSPAQTQIWRSKADDINRWARANQLRREKALKWKHDPIGWTRAHLEAGAQVRSQLDNTTYKELRREKRRLDAQARWATRKRNAERRLTRGSAGGAPSSAGASSSTAGAGDAESRAVARGGKRGVGRPPARKRSDAADPIIDDEDY